MPVTPLQKQLVIQSWKQLQVLDTKVAEIFYEALFAEEPGLRSMFKEDMNPQYRKLVDTLSFIVDNIEDAGRLTVEVKALALRHMHYGAKSWHYDAVGQALISALKKGMGNDWSIDLLQAWENTYDLLSGIMIDAVNEAAKQPN